jgi:hypothetical protein
LWDVWVEEWGESRGERSPVHGSDAQDAVENWAEKDDSDNDMAVLCSGLDKVSVAKVDSDEVTAWAVQGDSVPTYTATEAK